MNKKKIANELRKVAKELDNNPDWKQPIKIEMHHQAVGIWNIFVTNDYDKYVLHKKLVDEDDFNKKVQPLIDKLIKTIQSIAE